MKERMALGKLPVLALQQRRQGLAKLLPPAEETLRGSLVENRRASAGPAGMGRRCNEGIGRPVAAISPL